MNVFVPSDGDFQILKQINKRDCEDFLDLKSPGCLDMYILSGSIIALKLCKVQRRTRGRL